MFKLIPPSKVAWWVCFIVLASLGSVPAVTSAATFESLSQRYQKYLAWDKYRRSEEEPFFLEASETDDAFQARIGAIFEGVTFDRFSTALSDARQWCELVILHLNVKGCTAIDKADPPGIVFYAGRKEYQALDDAEVLELSFEAQSAERVLNVSMFAEEGPYDTYDYQLAVHAIPVPEGVYAEFRIGQRFGEIALRLGTLYLKTLGRNKVGFSVVKRDKEGEPVYVRGRRGVVERNAVRYLIALDVFFATEDLAQEVRFERRARMWFDETYRYRTQLYELRRSKYLEFKKKEYANQSVRQADYDRNGQALVSQARRIPFDSKLDRQVVETRSHRSRATGHHDPSLG